MNKLKAYKDYFINKLPIEIISKFNVTYPGSYINSRFIILGTKNPKYFLFKAGINDKLSIYKDGSFLYILSTNYSLHYIGLECIDINNYSFTEDQQSVFFQNSQDIESFQEHFNIKDVFECSSKRLIDCLLEYLI